MKCPWYDRCPLQDNVHYFVCCDDCDENCEQKEEESR
jgi:hypothetical protein